MTPLKTKKNSIPQEIIKYIKQWKGRWFFAVLGTQFLPIIEALVVASIFLLISPDQQAKALNWLSHLGWFGPQITSFISSHFALTVFVFSLGLLLALVVLKYANELNLIKIKYNIYMLESQRLIHRYLYMSPEKTHQIGKERITSSIINDSGAIGTLTKYSFDILGAILMALVYTASLFFLSWELALMILAIFAIPIIVNRRRYNKMEAIGQLRVTSQEKNLQFFTDLLNGFLRLKVDALENPLMEESRKMLDLSHEWRDQKQKTKAALDISMDGLSLFLLVSVLFAGLSLFGISLATLTTLFVIFTRMKSSITTLSNSYILIRNSKPHALRYLELMAELGVPPLIGPNLALLPVHDIRQIEMRKVSFFYDNDCVIQNADFVAAAGDHLLIQGPSGHGKSTFLQLLCGILPPSSGDVLYNGKPLRDELFYSYRPRISYVSPTVYLFDMSLRGNLVMGTNASEQDLQNALKLSGLDHVLRELPQGLETPVGAGGCNLSLGQKQRVVLARLYLKHPQLVIFDEATSNLDQKLENNIIRNLFSFLDPQAIFIMVAHKVPHEISFNKRYIMENGLLRPLGNEVPSHHHWGANLVISQTD